MHYELQGDGSLRLLGADERTVFGLPVDADFAVLVDASNGTLHKHGDAEVVGQIFARWTAAFSAAGMDRAVDDLEVVRVPVSRLTREAVDEINACMATSGRALHLKERLGAREPPPKYS